MNYKKIIPLKNKSYDNHVTEVKMLYIFIDQKIYLMDNHKCSLWCFLQEINKKDYGKYAYIHIDEHLDLVYDRVVFDQINKCGLEYHKDKNNLLNINNKIIHDNYLAPAIKFDFFDRNKLYFFAPVGDVYSSNDDIKNVIRPRIKRYTKKNVKDLEMTLRKEKDIVLNIDFDYFFDFKNSLIIKQYFKLIKSNINKIKFIIIALTPSNNWVNSEKILKMFVDIFKLKIEIPLKY